MMIRNPLLYICAILFLTVGICNSQTIDKEKLLSYVGTGNAGTEFYVTFPASYEEVAGAENTTRLFVISAERQPVTVEVPGKGFSQTRMAIANEVMEFKIPSAIGQAYSKSSHGKAPPEKIYGKCGVHVTSLSPIIVYGMTRFQYTSDGFLAIPISKLGTEYIIAAYPQYTAVGSSFKLPSLSNIVAAYDNTKITFTMGGNGGSKTTGGLKAGQSSTWNLNKGDVLCFANDDDNQDISGSHVVADKPIGIVSGNQCVNVPAGVPWCDFIDEMELPITAWGKEYHIAPIAERLYNPIIRIFAHPAYKNVKVYRDGKEWLVLPNNTRTENQSFVERRVFDGPPRATVVTANAPIYIMLYNPGESDDNVRFAPFQMVITPYEQYQTEITFSPPNVKGGTLPFTKNFVDLIYSLDNKNKIPDDLEIAEVKDGQFEWKKLSDLWGKDIGLKFSVLTNGEQFAIKNISLPQNGTFKVRAKKAFAAYLSGYSDGDSYGYPASVNAKDLTIIDTIPPTITVKNITPTVWSGIMEDYIVKRIQKIPGEDTNDLRGYIASAFLAPDSLDNVGMHYDHRQSQTKNPLQWQCQVWDITKDAHAVFVVTDKSGNVAYKEFKYVEEDTNVLVLYPAKKMKLNIAKDTIISTELTLKSLSKVLPIRIGYCIAKGDTNFRVIGEKLQDRALNPEEEIKIPITFKTNKVGNYSTTVYVLTYNNKRVFAKVEAIAVESGISFGGRIAFDSTDIVTVNINQPAFSIKAETGEFADTAYVTNIISDPPNAIGFKENEFGTEGFQIDSSLFMNKYLIPQKNEIIVPVRFKPVREGYHRAMIRMYMLNDKWYGWQIFEGYGRVPTSIDETSTQPLKVYLNTTLKELIIQSEELNKGTTYSVYNYLGENILSGLLLANQENHIIPLQNVSAGLYIFETEINGKRVQEKFVVSHQ